MTGVRSSPSQWSCDVLSFLRFHSAILSFLPSFVWVFPLLAAVIEYHSLISTLPFDIILVCCRGLAAYHRYQDMSVSVLFVMFSMSHISSITIVSNWQIPFSLHPWLLMKFFIVVSFFIHHPCGQFMSMSGGRKPCRRCQRLGIPAIGNCAAPGRGSGFQGRATTFPSSFPSSGFCGFFLYWRDFHHLYP